MMSAAADIATAAAPRADMAISAMLDGEHVVRLRNRHARRYGGKRRGLRRCRGAQQAEGEGEG
jgi:hypothetical protein